MQRKSPHMEDTDLDQKYKYFLFEITDFKKLAHKEKPFLCGYEISDLINVELDSN